MPLVIAPEKLRDDVVREVQLLQRHSPKVFIQASNYWHLFPPVRFSQSLPSLKTELTVGDFVWDIECLTRISSERASICQVEFNRLGELLIYLHSEYPKQAKPEPSTFVLEIDTAMVLWATELCLSAIVETYRAPISLERFSY